MTTTADLIQETKRYLLATHREQLNRINGAITSSQTSLTFRHDLGGLRMGSYLSIDLEIMYIWSTDASAKTATVERGMNGSTAAAHTDNSIVTINPKFPDFAVLSAINNDLKDLSGRGLFQVNDVTFTFIAGKFGYNLNTTSILSGIDARYDPPGPARDWPSLRQWKIRRDSDLTDFPSGFSFILQEEAHPGRSVRVSYAAPYGQLAALTDDVETTTGLQSQGHDIPSLGAAFRLEAVREGQRNFNEAQPNSRRSTEVGEGAQITSTRGLIQLRESRIRSLMAVLNKQYPNRRSIK
jgi:hypothetical protein